MREVDQEYENEESEVADVSEDWGIHEVVECRTPRRRPRGGRVSEPVELRNRFGLLAEAEEILETAEECG